MRGRKDRVAAWRDHEIYQANRHTQKAKQEFLDQARRTKGVRVVETSLPDPDGLTVTPGSMREALVHQLGAKMATDQEKLAVKLIARLERRARGLPEPAETVDTETAATTTAVVAGAA